MTWYYANQGQQVGPLSESDFAALVREGIVREDTLVWREGMANWLPWAQVRSAGADVPSAAAAPQAAPTAVPAGGMVCSECGNSFPAGQVVRYGDRWVCATCKPGFLQRLREGAPGGGARGAVSQEELLARDYEVDLGGCLGRSWEVFKSSAGVCIGATALVYAVLFGVGFIPYLGLVLPLFLTGPLFGGLWLFFVKKVRGQQAGVEDAFGGFGPRFVPLMLAGLVTTLLSYLCLAPAGVLVLIAAVGAWASGQAQGDFGGVAPVLLTVTGLLALVGFGGMVYLSVRWFFALPLVIDKGLDFWPAMRLSWKVVGKHWWMTLWLVVVWGVIASVGLLACVVGVLVTVPVAMGMAASHYQKVFGDLAAEA